MNRLSRSPANSRRSSSLRRPVRLQKSSSSRNGGKPPRTVHIDVYCTGSDRDSVSSSMDSSTTSSEPSTREYQIGVQNAMEMASNSTNPTVYQSYGMKLKHRRASKEDLPRKYLIDKETSQSHHSNGSIRGELISLLSAFLRNIKSFFLQSRKVVLQCSGL